MISNGIDIVNINRFDKIVNKYGKVNLKNKFLLRIFTINELSYLISRNAKINTIAARFSAKEACIKAYNPIYKITNLHDLEILEDIPLVKLNKKLHKNISISISHEKDYAISSCVVQY